MLHCVCRCILHSVPTNLICLSQSTRLWVCFICFWTLRREGAMTNYHSSSGNDTLKLCGRHTCLPVALLLPLKVSPPLLHHLKETRGCPLEFRKKWAAYLPSIMLCSWLPPLPPWVGIALCLPGSGSEAGCGANSGKQVSKDAWLVLGGPFLFIQAEKLWIRETAVPKTSLVNQWLSWGDLWDHG